jgi:hypothetical protein
MGRISSAGAGATTESDQPQNREQFLGACSTAYQSLLGGLAAGARNIFHAQTNERAMQNGPRINMNSRPPRSSGSFNARPKRWDNNGARDRPRGNQNAQRSYERYVALAQAEAQAGDRVAAENYYQHAEHFFRSMHSDPETT